MGGKGKGESSGWKCGYKKRRVKEVVRGRRGGWKVERRDGGRVRGRVG